MSWWGGSKEEPKEKGFVADDANAFHGSDIGGGASYGGGGAGGLSEFQQFSIGLQQQMVVQQAITDLSDRAFQKCITSTKDAELSGREVACIHAVTNKWLDSNQFMVGRLAKKQQQAASSSFG